MSARFGSEAKRETNRGQGLTDGHGSGGNKPTYPHDRPDQNLRRVQRRPFPARRSKYFRVDERPQVQKADLSYRVAATIAFVALASGVLPVASALQGVGIVLVFFSVPPFTRQAAGL